MRRRATASSTPAAPLAAHGSRAKLILVGQGGAGRTSLVRTLITGKFNPNEETTEGIKISDWSCPLAEDQPVTLHIWDFGGQEMMHATHRFFLTARSLYLLVLNRRNGGYDREADYWFRLIRAFGGKDAPVLVVLNKQRKEPFDVNRGGWLEKYAGNIRGFAETDCADAESIALLERKIQQQPGELKDIKTRFPGRWFKVKDELAHMGADYVTFGDYRALCKSHGEADPEQQTMWAGFLHDLGIALNYKNDPRLRFAYVLKPEWVTGGIYALLHAFVAEKGLFSRDDAERALAGKNYTLLSYAHTDARRLENLRRRKVGAAHSARAEPGRRHYLPAQPGLPRLRFLHAEAELIAYVLKPCLWKETKSKKFQLLPKDGKSMGSNKPKFWLEVCEGIQKALVRLQEQRASRPGRDAFTRF